MGSIRNQVNLLLKLDEKNISEEKIKAFLMSQKNKKSY